MWSVTTFQHYRGYSSHYTHTLIVHTGERKKDRRDRNRIQRDMGASVAEWLRRMALKHLHLSAWVRIP